MIHDVKFISRDGSVRNLRVYDRLMLKDGDIITLPVDGQLRKAPRTYPAGKTGFGSSD